MKRTENTRADILSKKLGYKKKQKLEDCLFFEKIKTTSS
jgi:hypothetical protein